MMRKPVVLGALGLLGLALAGCFEALNFDDLKCPNGEYKEFGRCPDAGTDLDSAIDAATELPCEGDVWKL